MEIQILQAMEMEIYLSQSILLPRGQEQPPESRLSLPNPFVSYKKHTRNELKFQTKQLQSIRIETLESAHRYGGTERRIRIDKYIVYLLEPDRGLLHWRTNRFFCRNSLSGVSSTTRLAIRSASSSQPAMAAADLNLGLK